jgi:DNA-binding NtrC family response regulator
VKEGRFREDLYYRLNVISLAIPPLRERPEDIPVLANHFLEKHSSLVGEKDVKIQQHAMDELMRHDWPGNARELEHVIERALAFCGGNEIRPSTSCRSHATSPTNAPAPGWSWPKPAASV